LGGGELLRGNHRWRCEWYGRRRSFFFFFFDDDDFVVGCEEECSLGISQAWACAPQLKGDED
jgi:hypothetical protein